ncbi:tetratricopeptide repeat-containing sensor histidine kinase [Winogradskyella flava]|uniref:Tetratricopeptide repeat protein n=1 Tax=Winogradskyella flava TaxID=1884876 RepID=A0A842IWD3_9FLAO|nr:tetratricopeptide repeat protein [Winogradskyella flava]MBC2846026.1 tetratricopeptide repeat protein [Winogradskyella flava]
MRMNFLKSLLLLSILIFSSVVIAQNKVIDSLKFELQIHTEKDTIRMQILNDLAYYNYLNHTEEALDYAERAASLADEINSIKGKGQSHYMKGISYVQLDNYNAAIDNFNAAIEIFISLDYLKGLAGCNNALGVLYHYQGDLPKAIGYFQKAMTLEKRLKIKENIPNYLHNIASLYADLGNYEDAFINFEKALSIFRENNNRSGMLNCWNAMALAYVDQGNYPVALTYHNKSLEAAEKTKDSSSIFISFHNIGNLYKQKGNYDKALDLYNRALSMKQSQESLRNVMAIKNSMGGLYLEKKDYNKATILIKESLALSREINDQGLEAICLINLGHIYVENKNYPKALNYYKEANEITIISQKRHDLIHSHLGLADVYLQTNNQELALSNANIAVELANKHQYLVHEKNAYDLLSKIYKKTSNYEKALQSHEHFKRLDDSIFNKENIEKITQLEYEYKYKQALDSAKIKELKLTKTVQTTSQDLEKSQRNYLLAVIGVLLLSILLGAIVFYQKLKNAKSKTQNAIMEQKLLRSQMTPHFIFNSLSVLQGMILNKEEKKSVHYLSKFSKLLRITLENSRDKTVLLSQELTAVQDYLALQNLENDAYKCTILVEDSIDIPSFEIPPMLIQPFVENAIEHAFVNQIDDRKIDIRLMYIDKKLICTIADNGIGINSKRATNNKSKNSLATTITSERLKVLSKDYNMEGSVTIEDRAKHDKKGTLVTLVIPHKINAV